ncbi:MAG: saccharopine dehydrogenase NADP-binding domain-containing protein [Salinibacter sp.]
MSYLLYGAYGYTGRLIARRALAQGHRPVLAGRNEAALRPLAASLGLPARTVRLSDPSRLRSVLGEVEAVLHCAGPFAETAGPMVAACLDTGTSYLDITGELEVFSALARRDDEAKEAGIVLLPGVGFDVVPTDCMAAALHERVPSATTLEIAFMSSGGWSPGTLKTALRQLGRGGLVRREGELVSVPPGWGTRTVDFGDHPRTVISIPWGDLVTAAHSTGIPNVTTYTYVPRLGRQVLRTSRHVQGLLENDLVQVALRRLITWLVPGPSEDARRQGQSVVWASVRGADGRRQSARVRGPEAYTLTARTAVAATAEVLEGTVAPGYHTPATAFGASFILERDGVEQS